MTFQAGMNLASQCVAWSLAGAFGSALMPWEVLAPVLATPLFTGSSKLRPLAGHGHATGAA
jgi:hypothetical protein